MASPTSGTFTAGQDVAIAWTAANVPAGSKISLCYDPDMNFWNGNETWIEVDQVAAANGAGSYIWNTTGVPTGTYYVAGYLWNGSSPTYSHLNQPIAFAVSSDGTSSQGTFYNNPPNTPIGTPGETPIPV